MTKKKILHLSANIIHDYSKNNHTRKIWNELSKGFGEYHLLARNTKNRYKHIYIKENSIYLHLLPKIFEKSKSYFFTSILLFYIIKKYNITHLLSQCPILGGFNGIIASKLFKIPIMVEIHGDIYFRYFSLNKKRYKPFRMLTLFVWNNSTKVRSLSEKMIEDLNKIGVKKNVVIIPNRVNLSLFNSPKINFNLRNPIRIISVGRFVEEKGFDIAISAIENLSGQINVELILVGGGKLHNNLISLTKNSENIKLLSWLKQEELCKILQTADLYIQPSKSEAMPRTILEAMAMRLPIIASAVGAVPGILKNHENAILIKPNSVKELEKAIVYLVSNKNIREKIAHQVYQDVINKYEWNHVFNLYRNEILSMKYENT